MFAPDWLLKKIQGEVVLSGILSRLARVTPSTPFPYLEHKVSIAASGYFKIYLPLYGKIHESFSLGE